MKLGELSEGVLERRAVVYVRQSTTEQLENNTESTRRQYALVELAKECGFRDVAVIDDDLGRSASGVVDRPGFRRLVAEICDGSVGAVFCLEASRLARNGREWHHLLELCGLMDVRVIDSEGCYDAGSPNDRLLLGLKGTMSEFELTLLRTRMKEGAKAKVRRGEMRITVPVGFVWAELGLMMDPDLRVQEAVRSVFRLFERLGSARQVMLHMQRENITFPSRRNGRAPLRWSLPVADSILGVLKNPFYAGAYAYGKTETRTVVDGGVVRKTAGHRVPRERWTALIRDHHEAYIPWDQFERNLATLARNNYSKPAGSAKSGRGGRALLSSLLRCARCGRMLTVQYSKGAAARYVCRAPVVQEGGTLCNGVGVRRPDEAITRELLLAVQPAAMEAAVVAHEQMQGQLDEKRRALELELEQADYEVTLAARRYEAVDPTNRLVARELETRWNAALVRRQECQVRVSAFLDDVPDPVPLEQLAGLALDLEAAWSSPGTDMKTKQRLVRALIEEIIVDVDRDAGEVQLVIHWRGGQHSEVRVPKLRAGEHGRRTPEEAERVIREMANKWPDAEIARSLNRMGLRTGTGGTWNAQRVQSFRVRQKIPKYDSIKKDGACLTMNEAARRLGVTNHVIRKLIDRQILPARQVVYDAPWQIQAADLERPEVLEAVRTRRRRRGRPCRNTADERSLMIPGICQKGAE